MISQAGTLPISSHGLEEIQQEHGPSASQPLLICLCHGALDKEISSTELGVLRVGKIKIREADVICM